MILYNIVVTYNRSAMLRRVLTELDRNGFRRIIVVNNNSTDDTADVLAEFNGRFDEFHPLTLSENSGGAGGFAAGMRKFLAVTADQGAPVYALLHDDDSWPNFAFSQLAAGFDLSTVIGTFPVIHPDGDLVSMNRPGDARFLRNPLFAHEYFMSSHRPMVLSDFEDRTNFEYCSFVGFLIRRDAMRALGTPSKEFFIYSDDIVYSYLASRRFGPIANLYRGTNTFTHDCNRSTGRSLLNSRFAFYDVRNKIVLFRLLSRYSLLFSVFFVLRSLALAPNRAEEILRAAAAGYSGPLSRFRPVSAEVPSSHELV
jgi:GT2 family glycosyltransferase